VSLFNYQSTSAIDPLTGLPVDPRSPALCPWCGASYAPASVPVLEDQNDGRCLVCGRALGETHLLVSEDAEQPADGGAPEDVQEPGGRRSRHGCGGALVWALIVGALLYCGSGKWTSLAPIAGMTQASAPRVAGTASAKKGTTLKGTIAPPRIATVSVTVQVRTKKKWRTYKAYAASADANGSWTLKIRPKKGAYRAQAGTYADAIYSAGRSAWGAVVVK
jgi:hypothetical protein